MNILGEAEATGTLDDVETPTVTVDRARLAGNIGRVAAMARGGPSVRPHGKTHKSDVIAALQAEAGAVGLTASKSQEAAAFIAGGVRSLTVAYPLVDPRKVARVLAAAQEHGAEARFIVDSPAGLAAIEQAACERGAEAVGIFVKVDVGLGRCGVDPDGEEGPDLAARAAASPRLAFRGLLSHAGHAYGAPGPDAIRAIAAHERQLLARLRLACSRKGLDVPEISVGSTPTVLSHDGFEGVTEIRPGNYVFLDLTQVALGVARLAQVALSVVATVVSANDRYLIADAGSKVLSSDAGAHGTSVLTGYGRAFGLDEEPEDPAQGLPVAKLSEEHAFIEHGGRRLPPGSRIRIYPNHACVVANLASRLALCEGASVLRWLPVTAGGGRVW